MAVQSPSHVLWSVPDKGNETFFNKDHQILFWFFFCIWNSSFDILLFVLLRNREETLVTDSKALSWPPSPCHLPIPSYPVPVFLPIWHHLSFTDWSILVCSHSNSYLFFPYNFVFWSNDVSQQWLCNTAALEGFVFPVLPVSERSPCFH